MEKNKFSSVSLPIELIDKIKKRIKDTGFTSVSSFVEYVMRELVAGEAGKGPFTKEDEKHVKERLKALGYI
jgi:Arc/MetJ-type ribon-helix-helix transcriptional regulator